MDMRSPDRSFSLTQVVCTSVREPAPHCTIPNLLHCTIGRSTSGVRTHLDRVALAYYVR